MTFKHNSLSKLKKYFLFAKLKGRFHPLLHLSMNALNDQPFKDSLIFPNECFMILHIELS